MLINALFISFMYKPYPRDVEKVRETLAARQDQLSAGGKAQAGSR
jgi:hypothetical protein